MANKEAIRERLQQVCYQHILPHMKRYEAEPDIMKCLPLMEPRVFAGFAYQACCDAAAVTVRMLRQQYSKYGRNIPPYTLEGLTVRDGDEEYLRTAMVNGTADFNNALERFQAALQRFQQLVGQAYGTVFQDGADLGAWSAATFGLPGLLVAAAATYINGRRGDQQLQAECERLQQEFNVMLQAYDQVMGAIISYSTDLVVIHRKELVAAMRSVY